MEMVSNPSSIAIAHRFCNYLKVPTYLQDSPPLVIVSAQPQDQQGHALDVKVS